MAKYSAVKNYTITVSRDTMRYIICTEKLTGKLPV